MTETVTPFDFIKAVSHTKEDLFQRDDVSEKDYNSFMVNRGLSYFPDTILYANEMNLLSHIPQRMQFEYYRQSIRSKNRFAKWDKMAKSDDLSMICNEYSCNPTIGKSYLNLLSEKDLEKMRKKYNNK